MLTLLQSIFVILSIAVVILVLIAVSRFTFGESVEWSPESVLDFLFMLVLQLLPVSILLWETHPYVLSEVPDIARKAVLVIGLVLILYGVIYAYNGFVTYREPASAILLIVLPFIFGIICLVAFLGLEWWLGFSS